MNAGVFIFYFVIPNFVFKVRQVWSVKIEVVFLNKAQHVFVKEQLLD